LQHWAVEQDRDREDQTDPKSLPEHLLVARVVRMRGVTGMLVLVLRWRVVVTRSMCLVSHRCMIVTCAVCLVFHCRVVVAHVVRFVFHRRVVMRHLALVLHLMTFVIHMMGGVIRLSAGILHRVVDVRLVRFACRHNSHPNIYAPVSATGAHEDKDCSPIQSYSIAQIRHSRIGLKN
jgi:hypothetical protein